MTLKQESTVSFAALLFVILTCSNTRAQDASKDEAMQHSAANPEIIKVQDPRNPSSTRVNIWGTVEIEVTQLKEWLEEKKSSPSKVILYLDGLPLTGLVMSRPKPDCLSVRLQPTSESRSTWSQLLGGIKGDHREFQLSIGLPGEPPLKKSQTIDLQVFSKSWAVFYIVLLAVLLVLFGLLARYSNIIRDTTALPAPVESGSTPAPSGNKPYSLAKLQMAVWFFLVFAAFLFIWFVTGQYDSITPETLILMGIASGTALGSSIIDSNRNHTSVNELTELQPQRDSLRAEIVPLDEEATKLRLSAREPSGAPASPQVLQALQAAVANVAAKTALKEQLDQKVKDAESRKSRQTSNGFLQDLLSDANGYSFARFQVFAWTILLGILFVGSVWSSLSMPAFGSTLLGLMGVSGATFLGFGFEERPSKPS